MSRDPKFSYPEFPDPIHHEPVDPPEPEPAIVVSAALFDLLATTLGAGRVESDGTMQYVRYNGHEYATLLLGVTA